MEGFSSMSNQLFIFACFNNDFWVGFFFFDHIWMQYCVNYTSGKWINLKIIYSSLNKGWLWLPWVLEHWWAIWYSVDNLWHLWLALLICLWCVWGASSQLICNVFAVIWQPNLFVYTLKYNGLPLREMRRVMILKIKCRNCSTSSKIILG